MSNGTLAELPPENLPDGILSPVEPSVLLLLPHNKYLLGNADNGTWIYSDSATNTTPKNVFLYDNQALSLVNENSQPTVLSALTVNALRRELFSLTEPPGIHSATVLMLRTFMKEHNVFNSEDAAFLDENIFNEAAKNDSVLFKSYWALRFALARNEMETAGRLKAWLKADPKTFSKSENNMKIWFSLLDQPDKNAISELEELSFSRLELKRMTEQNSSPLLMYNPISGWLLLGRFGRVRTTMFMVWVYLNDSLWHELKEMKKMSLHDIILAAWGEYETQQAVTERAKYKGS